MQFHSSQLFQGRPIVATDRSFLVDLHGVLERLFMDKKLRVPTVAQAIGISDRQLQRRVRTATGMTPAQYVAEFRLLRARDWLRGGVAIGDVAHAAGFSSHAYFAHLFRRRFGITPSTFRNKKKPLES